MTKKGEQILRRLAVGDPDFCSAVMGRRPGTGSEIDARTYSVLRLAGCICMGTAPATWRQSVDTALCAGLGFDDVVDCLVNLAPIIGIERMIAAAPMLADALGYPLDNELEGTVALEVVPSSHTEEALRA